MAGLAALFASPALPFPSTSTSTSSSCSCRFRPAVACAPRQRHLPAPRRVTRRFDEVEGTSRKRRGIGGGGGGGSQASSTRKDKGLAVDFKESRVADFEDLEEDKFLNAVVKVYCTHIRPDYGLPWQKQRQHASTGSAFMIGDGKLLTNAHCVEHDTQVKVKRRGDDKKYVAKVLARGTECDLALLSVENEEFWRGTEPLQLGRLPCLQDSVTVVGYPLGGDTISVTKGVVSRIEEEKSGYMPPEFIEKGQISNKFDVFSLGVIIIRIMAGREGYSKSAEMTSQQFTALVHENWRKRRHAKSSYTSQELDSLEVKTCIEIALRCVEVDRVKRPTVTEIINDLKKLDTAKRPLVAQSSGSQEEGLVSLQHGGLQKFTN